MKYFSKCIALIALTHTVAADPVSDAALARALEENPEIVVGARDGNGVIETINGFEIEAIDGDPLVDIGSNNKFVTAVALLHLSEANAFTTEANIGQLLPDVPADKENITLHQLLTHTSGLTTWTGEDGEALDRDTFLSRVFDAPLESVPGTTYEYSNPGYSVLAAVIEVQSGMDYEDYLIDVVLTERLPAIGYARAYDPLRSIRTARQLSTIFQRLRIDEASWGSVAPGWNLIGNGGAVTTAEGFLRFWAAFQSGEIIDPLLVDLALTAHVTEDDGEFSYGYGIIIEDLPGIGVMYWHDGGNDYFTSEWRHIVSKNLTFFAAGTGESAYEAINAMITEELFD